MSGAGWFALGVLAGFAVVSAIRPTEGSCCQRVAFGARDKIAGYFGTTASPAVAYLLDGSGITNALPGLIDFLGLPKDA